MTDPDTRPRSLSFGAVAEQYERFRPGYPDVLVDRIFEYSTGRLAAAVEIGAGTGKATRLIAGRGIAVTALEPDREMLAVLALQTAGDPVSLMHSTFEAFTGTGPFDLLFAAAAWHWTDPATRWDRSAALVRPGGTLAFFGGPWRLADGAVREAVVGARTGILPDDEIHSPTRPGELEWPGSELVADPRFTDVREELIPRGSTIGADEYVGCLSTVSAYLMLDPDVRATLLGRIREVLPERVEIDAAITLHLARRGPA